MSQTLYDKLMSAHIVHDQDGASLIYIDLQLIHEVTSPKHLKDLLKLVERFGAINLTLRFLIITFQLQKDQVELVA